MQRAGATIVLACCALLLASACRPTPSTGTRPADTGRTVLHAVESARLRTIMQSLERLRAAPLPQELDPGLLLDRRLDEMAAAGDGLAAAATEIAAAADDLGLDPAQRPAFLGIVDTLRRQALTLRSRAGEGDLDAAVRAYDELTATCDACHALFREPAGGR
jgi:hypothetical protein